MAGIGPLDKFYPSPRVTAVEHSSGAGAISADYTGTSAATLDCTTLAGCHVSLYSVIKSSQLDGATYKYCWITSAEASSSPDFVAVAAAASLATAANLKVGKKLNGDGKFAKEDYVDAQRPILLFKPLANVAAAENIVVAVSQTIDT